MYDTGGSKPEAVSIEQGVILVVATEKRQAPPAGSMTEQRCPVDLDGLATELAPSSLARRRPARTLSIIRLRSNSATTETITNTALPTGLGTRQSDSQRC